MSPSVWILNDAIHWSLNKNNAVFVILDGEIYYNSDKLMQTVTDYKSLDKPPLQILPPPWEASLLYTHRLN